MRRERERSDFCRYEDAAGRVVDFHALRVTYATSLGRQGVPLQKAQKLMRHSDPKLTSNAYTRFELHDLHDAVARIGRPLCPPSRPPSTVTSVHDVALPCTESDDTAPTPDMERARPASGKARAKQAPSWCPL
ncbi:MAG: tyrosine-type recombinase/integrase [Planctomycetota bacterium]